MFIAAFEFWGSSFGTCRRCGVGDTDAVSMSLSASLMNCGVAIVSARLRFGRFSLGWGIVSRPRSSGLAFGFFGGLPLPFGFCIGSCSASMGAAVDVGLCISMASVSSSLTLFSGTGRVSGVFSTLELLLATSLFSTVELALMTSFFSALGHLAAFFFSTLEFPLTTSFFSTLELPLTTSFLLGALSYFIDFCLLAAGLTSRPRSDCPGCLISLFPLPVA